MTSEELWLNLKNAEPSTQASGPGASTDCATLTAHYTRLYSEINPLVQGGKLDFRKIAERSGLKERKIREVLLSRLIPHNSVELVGHRAGFCFICSARIKETSFPEPLCITCLSMITRTIEDLYPPEQHAVASILSEGASADQKAEPMIPWEQYESILQEVTQYRQKYGLLEAETIVTMTPTQPSGDMPLDCRMDHNTVPADEPPTDLTEQDIEHPFQHDNEPENQDSPSDTVTSPKSPNNDVMRLLNSDETESEEGETLPINQPSSGPMRHFGFQKAKPRW